jgi:hypothetical protein
MASLIRRGYTGGSALTEAVKQCHLEWHAPALQASWTPEQGRASGPKTRQVPEPELPPAPKRQRMVKPDGLRKGAEKQLGHRATPSIDPLTFKNVQKFSSHNGRRPRGRQRGPCFPMIAEYVLHR